METMTTECRYLGSVSARSQLRILLLNPTPPAGGAPEGPRSLEQAVYLAQGTSVEEAYLLGAPQSYDSGNRGSAVAQATPLIVERVRQAESEGYDAVVVNCTVDPGVAEAQAQVNIPVVGIGAASRAVASLLGRNPATLFPEGIKVLELADDAERTYADLARHGRWLITKRGADVLIPDCAYLGGLADRLQQDLGVPVLHNQAVGLKIAELLAGLNVRPEQPWVADQRASRMQQTLSRIAAGALLWIRRLR
jgi:Asp/Glu/hydantoin racemase